MPDFMQLMKLDKRELLDKQFRSRILPEFRDENISAFDVIRNKELLVHHPFDSFTNSVLKLLNEVLEEVFEDTKKYTSRISVALDKNSYAFSNDKWLLRHENQTLASYKITVEDLKTIHDILDKQHYFFENGKWKIRKLSGYGKR